jgi:hypothetical protein
MNGFLLHDFHVSICEVEYDQQRKALEVTHKLFLDDLEQSLIKWSGNTDIDVINAEDSTAFQELLRKYLLENFAVKANEKNLNMVYLGAEIEGDIMYAFIDIVDLKKFRSLEIRNTIFMNLFADQTNIVHVEVDKDTKSLKLNKRSPEGKLEY